MAYGRLNEQGQLISANTQLDDSFQELSLFEIKDADGNGTGEYYEFYKTDGSYVPDTEKIQALAVLKMIADGEKLVDKYVQTFIDAYNEANGVNFTNVDSCNKYVAQTDYSHQQFCIDIVAFNCKTWETARGLYVDGTITSETTEEDFIALLPVLEKGE